MSFAVTTLMRPEGMLFFLLSLSYAVFHSVRRGRGIVVAVLPLLCGFGILIIPYFLWRYTYYGYLFPNTFYVKVSPSAQTLVGGAKYAIRFLRLFGLPLSVLPLLWLGSLRKVNEQHIYYAMLVSGYGLYVVLVGGDHMPGFRFFVPVLPLLYRLVEDALLLGKLRISQRFCTTLLILFLAVNLYALRSTPTIKDPAAYIGEKVGMYIKEHWPEGSTVALNTAGSTPYISGFLCIDMLGLNNVVIAHHPVEERLLEWQKQPGHEKGYGAYVLSLKPDYVIIGPAQGSTEPWFLGDKEILDDPTFSEHYNLCEVTIPVKDPRAVDYKPTERGVLTFRYYKSIHKAS
jgi:hypothetical protein